MKEREQTGEQLGEEIERLRRRVAELEEQQERNRSSDLMLRSIVRAVPDIIYRLDVDGQIVFINEAVRNYGYEPDELIGTNIFQLVHPEDRAKAAYRINERRTGERSTRLLELRLLTPGQKEVSFELLTADDNGEPTLLVNAEGIYASGTPQAGEFLYTQGVARDITERKWASRVLEKSREELSKRVAERTAELEEANQTLRHEERRQRALNRMREEVWRMNGESDIEKVIAALRDCLEMLEVPVQGCSIHVVREKGERLEVKSWTSDGPESGWDFEQVDPAAARNVLDMWRRGQPVYRQDMEADDPYGEFAPISEYFGHPVRSVLDVPYSHGTVGINHEEPGAFSGSDVQDLQALVRVLSEGFSRLEDFEALRKSEEQLRHSQKMEAVGQLTAGVAHHFNNMLQGIVGNLHLAMFDAQPGIKSFLEAAQDTSDRAAEMIRQLMVFAWKGRQPVSQVVDLAGVVRNTAGVCRKTFDRKIEIVESLPAEILVEGDRGQLQQVVMNLLLNARDAVAGPGEVSPVITIHAEEMVLGETADGLQPGTYASLRIEDNGVGMDEQTRIRVFEPFFTTKQVGQGTGLGLATAYAIVQQHGGAIKCHSELGTGSRMQVYLPIAGNTDAEEKTGTEEPPAEKEDA